MGKKKDETRCTDLLPFLHRRKLKYVVTHLLSLFFWHSSPWISPDEGAMVVSSHRPKINLLDEDTPTMVDRRCEQEAVLE